MSDRPLPTPTAPASFEAAWAWLYSRHLDLILDPLAIEQVPALTEQLVVQARSEGVPVAVGLMRRLLEHCCALIGSDPDAMGAEAAAS